MNRVQQAEVVALMLVKESRALGIFVEPDGFGVAFGNQFKSADRSAAAWVAVIGEQEAESGEPILKSLLVKGEERQDALDNSAQILGF